MRILKNLFFFFCLFVFTNLYATIWHVPDSISTIQAAIDSAANGDTILVAPGIYIETLLINGKNIVIGSNFLTTGDSTYIDSTIIDGNNTTRPVTILGSVDSAMVFTGFTVQNGSLGGIGCGQGASPIISYNIVRNNHGHTNYAGISCSAGNPIIRYNKIVGNINGSSITDNGGGIACFFSGSPIIYKNIIKNNYANKGGGIYCFVPGYTPIIRDNIIDGNISDNGGGIYCDNSSPVIRYNTISSDSASNSGGGIYCDNNSNPEIRYNLICDNQAINAGGGIYSRNSLPLIENNTICGNNSFFWGSAMYIESSLPNISNNIFANNTGSAAVVTGAALNYCDFYNNTGGHFSATPSGTGVITTINNNGDSCDVYYNIFMDPQFTDTTIFDFSLTENSPCIDAGDPASPLDPDNTIADIGAFYFDQSFPIIYVNQDSLEFGEVEIGAQKDTTFTIFNQGSDTLLINQISFNLNIFTTNFNPANNFILPNDNMIITVTFTPTDTGFVDDTLTIDNNDQLVEIYLSGTGVIFPFPVITVSDSLIDFGTVWINQSADSFLTIYNDGTDTLAIYSIFNNKNVYTHNFNSVDSLILPGDSLEIMVTFTPVDTSILLDTLCIDNNDHLLEIYLSGRGDIAAGINDELIIPKEYALYPAYPNPFNPTTTIKFDLPKQSFVTLKVYTILGEEVHTLISEEMVAGRYKYIWNGNNLASGIYLYSLQASDFYNVRKVILLK